MLPKIWRWYIAFFHGLIILLLATNCLHARAKILDDICTSGKSTLKVMYINHRPYIMESQGEVTGIFPVFLEDMVKTCCNVKMKVSYQLSMKPSDFNLALEEMRSNKFAPRFDMALPIYTENYEKKSFENLTFIAIAESLGIAMLKHGNVSSRKLMWSLLQAWPVLLFIILTASVAGIVIWFVERQSNTKQFSESFSQGAFDGFWWAFVSMTSVGYGDKYPKTVIGKILGSCWLVLGMLFVTMFLGILTTTLMTLMMEGTYDIQNKKVTVVNDSVAYWLGIEHHATVKVKKYEELYQPLIDYEVDAALVDINSLMGETQDLQQTHNIKVSGILAKETFYGLVLSRRAKHLAECFRRYIDKWEFFIFRNISQYNRRQQKTNLNPAEDYFGSGGIFSISVYFMIAVFVVFCCAGCIWEVHKLRNLNQMNENHEEYNSEEECSKGRSQLGTLSTSTEALSSDCHCHFKDPFETIDELNLKQSNV